MKTRNIQYEESAILALVMLKTAIEETSQPTFFAEKQLIERKLKAWSRLRENFQLLIIDHDGEINNITNQQFLTCIENWENAQSVRLSIDDQVMTNRQLMSQHRNGALTFFSFVAFNISSSSLLSLERLKNALKNNINLTI